MPFELAAKKAGLSVVRAFLHAVEGVSPALSAPSIRRNKIEYKLKTYVNGKLASVRPVTSLEDAFPCKGDTK